MLFASSSPRFVDVLLPLGIDTAYTYRLPAGLEAGPGSYMLVPIGTRQAIGVVWAMRETAPDGTRLRDVASLFDMPPMTEIHRRFIDWLADYYVEPKGNVLRLALRVPSAFEPPRQRLAYRATGQMPARLTRQRQRVLDILAEGLSYRPADLETAAGVSSAVLKSLLRDGAIESIALPPGRAFQEPDLNSGALPLSSEQMAAAQTLRAMVASREHKVALLDGVTGSGKTEVYFEAMAASLAAGRQVLLLLPEIALTQGFIARVERRFGCEPARWHSGLKPSERERVWRGAAAGQARIVVGARSALFLPWKNLGLIIVDEEHEQAYKQDDGVPYHARDMAVLYGAIGRFPVLLSSATPSLESLANVDRGRYAHIVLRHRHGQRLLPEITLLDMRTADLKAGTWISDPLAQEVEAALSRGEQALLFLNRRGYAPLTLCRTCGHRLECPQCSASLVEHRFRKLLLCHHCGHQESMPQACPSCRAEGQLVPCGPGIERLAEEARNRFPEARIVSLSSDLSRSLPLADVLRSVEQGEHNLVLGTQLVAKGHHFPHLTLVGVIDTDLALETADPRGGERTWALMAQVAGRAGRGDRPGRALVQSYVPHHPLMQALKSGDRDGYLAQEKTIREQALFPPYAQLAAVILSGADATETERFARAVGQLRPLAEGVTVLGPVPAPIHMLRGRHRWRFLVKASRHVKVQEFLRVWLCEIKPKGNLHLAIDVDPYNFL